MKYRIVALMMLSVLGLTACGEPADTHPGQPVAHRKQAFKAIFQSFDPMGDMLKNGDYDPDTFRALAKQLDARKDAPWQYFGPDTQYPPSHSTDAVWKEPQKFEQARKDFLAATARLVASAQDQNQVVVKANFQAVRDTCENCHKVFKNADR